MRGFIKVAKIAALVFLSAVAFYLIWANLVLLAVILSPKWSVLIVGLLIGTYVVTAVLATRGQLKSSLKSFWHWRQYLATMGVAYVIDGIVNWLFNYPLYSYVISAHGTLVGGGIMIILSFLVCWAYLIGYDIIKKDIFGIEMAKEFIEEWKEYEGDSWWRSLAASWLNRWGEAGIFVLLSLAKDPFYTVAGCRKGVAKFNGLSARDWKIFIGSVALGNIPWIIFIATGVWIWESGIDKAWPYIEAGFIQTYSWLLN